MSCSDLYGKNFISKEGLRSVFSLTEKFAKEHHEYAHAFDLHVIGFIHDIQSEYQKTLKVMIIDINIAILTLYQGLVFTS